MARDLSVVLEREQDTLRKHLQCSDAQWESLLRLTAHCWERENEESRDERVRTFALACGYAAARERGLEALTAVLTGEGLEQPAEPRIWLEALSVPPLKREGNTRLDLALGSVALRKETECGIEMENVKHPWVCMVELKWLSDISPDTRYLCHRNQLLRVIENALCFQKNGRYAERVFVTLVTPAFLQSAPVRSRLYHYKYEEYSSDKRAILWDLMGTCRTEEHRHEAGWYYPPSMPERIETLTLRWVTHDDLYEHLPDSSILADVREFWMLAQKAMPSF